ncbi:MAG TPA: hypothetical protein VF645_04940 [Allosphingosinicella sp.]|jgi:hypothetical protein
MIGIASLLLLQAGPALSHRLVQEIFQPYRQCLVQQGRPLASRDRSDSEILDHAAQDCLAESRASEAGALNALLEKGATREKALEQSARLREDAERVAVAILRASPDGLHDRVAIPRVRQQLDIPDEIASAILPYFLCRSASAGVPVYSEEKKQPVAPPPGVAQGASCDPQRAKAAADADGLLRRLGRRDEAARRSLIESTLAGVDEFHRASASSELEGEPGVRD